jgi:uncharacterized damage-inducible protein DinB
MSLDMKQELLEMWRVHEEISQFLLEKLPDEAFAATTLLKNGQFSKGRNVAQVFAHMHNLRRLNIGREFLAGVPKFEYSDEPSREELIAAFQASGQGIAKRLARVIETGESKTERPGIMLLGLLISHDSHHRGLILMACKQSGVRVPEEMKFGIWEHWLKPKLAIMKES